MTNQYEYVTRREYSPINQDFQQIINQVHKEMKQYDITFQHELIGSGSRRLVTRILGGNTGYDFDYNLNIQQFPAEFSPKKIKNLFRESFRHALKNSKYKDPEDSTSVLTIKMVDFENSRISHSFDMALTFRFEDGEKYIRNNKNGSYTWECRKSKVFNQELVEEIKDFYVDGWGLVYEEYLYLKNNNRDPNKHSYNLYVEAVNNVHHKMRQHPEYRDWKNQRELEDDYDE